MPFFSAKLTEKAVAIRTIALQKNSASEPSNSLALLVNSLKPYFRFFSLRLSLTIWSVS